MNTKTKKNLILDGFYWLRIVIPLFAIIALNSCGDDEGTAGPGLDGNVRISEIDVSGDQVTLTNYGEADVDISEYWFCLQRGYTQFTGVQHDGADLILSPNEDITFSITIDDLGSDVAIYNTGNAFASTGALVDFMQFGASFAGNSGREDVAVGKNIWGAGEFLSGDGPFSYIGDGSTYGRSQWSSSGTSAPAGSPNVRILSVNPGSDLVTLKNFGTEAQDISGFFFCRLKSYSAFSSLTISSGDLILSAGEEIEFTLTIDDTSSDVGVYNTGGAFGSSDAMVDFMQFGSDVGTAGRVNVAVAKGIWTDGEFVASSGPFDYTGDGDENGASFWQ